MKNKTTLKSKWIRIAISVALGVPGYLYVGWFHGWALALAIFFIFWGNNVMITLRLELDEEERQRKSRFEVL